MKHPVESEPETGTPGSWSDNGFSPCTIPTSTPSQNPGDIATMKKRQAAVNYQDRLEQNGGEYKKFKDFDPT